MIDGASQADCGVLVVNPVRGEYETGLERGGPTREPARLLRALVLVATTAVALLVGVALGMRIRR